ncbi:hypothetical protein ACWDFH_15435 [Streptomyces kronopolitis]|uniref:hypothetical protein n=1 Tax=Streptomyces kronopolitis TaxID=1612435 RepID=UPI003687F2B0
MTAVPPEPETPPTVHLPAQGAEPAVSGTVIPASSWPFRPGLPSTSSTAPSTEAEPVGTPAARPVPAVATAAGGSGDWLWRLPPSPPAPPGGGGMTPWHPAPAPDPWGGPAAVPAPVAGPQPLDIRIEFVRPPEPDLTWWQRIARAVPYRVSLPVAISATAAAIVPLHRGYGVARTWGSLLDHLGTDAHPALSHIAAAVALAVVAARIHRPCRLRTNLAGNLVRRLTWLDAFGVAVTFIGGSLGVLWPDLVAATTGVRA